MFSSAIERLNERRSGAGESGEDAGFTLIELMVVLLILAILLAIAIPTFLGVTKSANDRAVQSNLNTAMTNAKAAYSTNDQTYSGINVATLAAAEPSLSYTTDISTGEGMISMHPSTDGSGLVLAAFSTSTKDCYYLIDNTSGVTATGNAPWGATATGTQDTVDTTDSGAAVFSTGQGTVYAEVKGGTSSDCSASSPNIPSGSSYEWSTTKFPALS